MEKSKIKFRILSVFCVSMFMLQLLPLQVAAENVTEAIENKAFIESALENPVTENNTNDEYILYEIEEKRDEFTKVYKKSDGSFTAVMAETPLHYFNDGVWEEINNALTLDGDFYTNTNNLFNVSLPEIIDSTERLTVENDGYELSFNIEGVAQSPAVVENNIVGGDTAIDEAQEAIAQTQSSVTYNNVAENTDLQYIVTPNSIKENIIVSDKESVKDTYTFTFRANGLEAQKLEDGSVVFKNEQGKIKFTIPRPVMTDANLEFSYDIGVALTENSDGTSSLEYSPAKDWLNSVGRAYPVTIDPAISVENDEVTWVEDTFVVTSESDDSAKESNYYDAYLGILANTIDEDNGEIYTEIYTKFNMNAFKALGKNLVFTEAQYFSMGAFYNCTLLAKKIATPVELTTVTYEDKPTLENEVIDYYTSPFASTEDGEPTYIHFNLTKALNEWYNNDSDNNGFAIVPGSEGFWGALYLNGTASLPGSTTETYTTTLVLSYIDIGGYNEAYNHHIQSVGRAGTGYVNDFTQQLSVIREDLSIDGNVMPVSVGMVYNSATYGKIKSLNYNFMLVYGNGWTPNYLRAYVRMANNQLAYYSEKGAEINFTNYKTNNPQTCSGYKIEYFSASDGVAEHIVVTRPDGLEERFNSMGLLTSVTNPENTANNINVVYDTAFRIDYITDGVGRKYDYTYENGLLASVQCFDSENQPIKAGSTSSDLEVNYAYDENKNLTSVTFPDGKSVTYTYDESGNLTKITNIDGYRIVYAYNDKGKVENVTEQALDGLNYVNGNSVSYERLGATKVKITDGTGACETYQFNGNGTLLNKIDNKGNYSFDSILNSESYTPNSENLLFNNSFEQEYNILTPLRAKYRENSNSAFERIEYSEANSGNFVYVARTEGETTAYQKQTVEVLSGGKYTFSAYVKSAGENECELYLDIAAYSASNTKTENESVSVESTDGEWQRYWVTLEAPEDTQKIVVQFGFNSSGGTYYIDDVQLEQREFPTGYNYIENGGFRNGSECWENVPDDAVTNATINGASQKAVLLNGDVNSEYVISQIVNVNGKKGDVFKIGGWLKGAFVSSSTNNPIINDIINESDADNTVFNYTNDRFHKLRYRMNIHQRKREKS